MKAEQYSGIYEILNLVNGKRYIGSAVRFARRWAVHRCRLRRGAHDNKHLQAAWNKYGEAAFVFKPLLICAAKDLIDYEQRCLDGYRPEYNKDLVAGSRMGSTVSAETREKLRAQNKGKKPTQATIAKSVAANTGSKRSVETRAKMRAAQQARHALRRAAGLKYVFSIERREQMRQAQLGRVFSLEHRAKLSANAKRRPVTYYARYLSLPGTARNFGACCVSK